MAHTLTVKQIAKLTTLKQPGRYRAARGLYVKISDGGKGGSWVLRYEKAGVERFMGLGPLDDVSLKQARLAAAAARALLREEGIDPIDARRDKRRQATEEAAKAAAKDVSFEKAANGYYNRNSPNWKNIKHRKQFTATMATYVYPVFGKLPVGAIDKTLVLKVLQPIWQTKNETANRIRGRIENVLDYAKVNGWREGDNCAAWVGNLEHALPAPGQVQKVQHHAALPWRELPEFMEKLRQRPGISARALEFTILTAARTSEVVYAKRDEFDLDGARTWTIPPERMKAKKEHTVPLCDDVVKLLKALPQESDWMFVGAIKGASISNDAMTKVLERMAVDVTVHGFRSSFMDWAHERTDFPDVVINMALAHAIGDKVEAAYRRGELIDKRRRLMTAWAAYCMSPPRAASDSVVPLRRNRK